MLAPSTRKFWTTERTARKIAIVSRTVWMISQISDRAESPRDSLVTVGRSTGADVADDAGGVQVGADVVCSPSTTALLLADGNPDLLVTHGPGAGPALSIIVATLRTGQESGS